MTDLTLAPGQTAVIQIEPDLTYRVTNTGWTLAVESTQPIGVKPVGEKRVDVVCLGSTESET